MRRLDDQVFERACAGLAVVILLAGAWLRFYNLQNQIWPEADDLTTVEFTDSFVRDGVLGQATAGLAWLLTAAAGHLILGPGPLSQMLVAAALGSMSIVAVYFLGTRWHSRTYGLFAAILLALSLHHVHWSRWAQPHTAAMFCALAALLVYERAASGGRSLRLIAGALAGMVPMFYLPFAAFAIVPIVFELGSRAPVGRAPRSIRPVVAMSFATVSPLLAAEFAIRILRVVTGDRTIGSPIGLTIVNVWNTNSVQAGAGDIGFDALAFFWAVLWEYEGLPFTVFAVAGWALLTWRWLDDRRRQRDTEPSDQMWMVITIVFLSGTLFTLGEGFRKSRYVAPFVLAAVMSAAWFLTDLLRRLSHRVRNERLPLIATIVFGILWGWLAFARLHDRISMDTGFRRVWSVTDETGSQHVAFVGNPGVTNFWAYTPWNAVAAYLPVEPIMTRSLSEIEEMSPPVDAAVVGLGMQIDAPELKGFHLLRTVPVRIPKYDGRPVQDWSPNGRVHIYGRR